MVLLIDRLHIAAYLLSDTFHSILHLARQVGEDVYPYDGVPITSPFKDLIKNRALAYMRLEGMLTIGISRRENLIKEIESSSELRVSSSISSSVHFSILT